VRHFAAMASDRGFADGQPVPEERRRLIVDMLRQRRSISVGTAERQFRVSPMTARRDLAILAREGHARRTHGGAVLPDLAAPNRTGA
jgi:DeoR/GlpR family transcriptional regulator of sugar metabolism